MTYMLLSEKSVAATSDLSQKPPLIVTRTTCDLSSSRVAFTWAADEEVLGPAFILCSEKLE